MKYGMATAKEHTHTHAQMKSERGKETTGKRSKDYTEAEGERLALIRKIKYLSEFAQPFHHCFLSPSESKNSNRFSVRPFDLNSMNDA